MRMMEMIADKIVDVVSMRDWLVPASRAVDVIIAVAAALMIRSTTAGIDVRDLDRMFDHLIAFYMMQMSIMQIINVISVLNRCMATICTMDMSVVAMGCIRHRDFSPQNRFLIIMPLQ